MYDTKMKHPAARSILVHFAFPFGYILYHVKLFWGSTCIMASWSAESRHFRSLVDPDTMLEMAATTKPTAYSIRSFLILIISSFFFLQLFFSQYFRWMMTYRNEAQGIFKSLLESLRRLTPHISKSSASQGHKAINKR